MILEAFAKVNLTLEVLGERADGYHALRSLVVPVSLSDTLEVEETDDGTITSDSPYPDDLCRRAAHALQSCQSAQHPVHPVSVRGARIRITKRIPIGGGLGGGSADAAATLRALNDLWGLNLPRRDLAEVGARVGSDVPALVLGGAVLMEGRGERVTPVAGVPRLDLVLVHPGVSSSTPAVYAAYSATASTNNRTIQQSDNPEIWYNMRTALKSGDSGRIAAAMVNDLAFPATRLYPDIARALDALRDAGVERPMMSGSGSTVFGLVPSEARGREVAALLEAKGFKAWSVHTSVR